MEPLSDRPGVWTCLLGGESWYDGCQVTNPATDKEMTVREDANGAWIAPAGFARAGKEYRFTANGRKAVIYRTFTYFRASYGELPGPVALAAAYLLDSNETYLRTCGLLLGIRLELAHVPTPPNLFYADRQFFLTAYLMCRDELRNDDTLGALFAERGRIPGLQPSATDLWDKFERAFFASWKGITESADGIHDSYLRDLFTAALIARGASVPELAEWNIEKAPASLNNVTVNGYFRDGRSGREALGYNIGDFLLWEQSALPELLLGYDQGRYADRPVDLFTNQLLASRVRFCDSYCDGRLIPIGDTNSARHYVTPSQKYFSADEIWYRRSADPETRRFCAQRLGMACGFDAKELGELRKAAVGFDLLWILFHADEVDFSDIARDCHPQSTLFPDMGLAVLRSGKNTATRKHLALNLMKDGGHCVRDQMALFLFGFGYDLTGMNGYSYWGGLDRFEPKCINWDTASLHRWGVVADRENMGLPEGQDAGSLNHFISAPGAEFVDGENPDCVTGPLFRRMALLLPVSEDEHYVVDMFRAYGGKMHDYSFHSLGGAQAEHFSMEWDDGRNRLAPASGPVGPEWAPMYMWLHKTGTAAGDRSFRAHWRVGDGRDVGVVMHVPPADAREVVTGKGEGWGMAGESPWDPYLLLRERDLGRRWGSFFMTVVEPYQKKRFIKSVTPLAIAPAKDSYDGVDAKALAIETSGGTDIVMTALDRETTREIRAYGETIRFSGNLGVIRRRAGRTVHLLVAGGTLLEFGDTKIRLAGIPRGAITGLDPEQRAIEVKSRVSIPVGDALKGALIIIRNARYIAACPYFIDHVDRLDDDSYRIALDVSRLEIYAGKVERISQEEGMFTSIYPSARHDNNQELNGKAMATRAQPARLLRIGKMSHTEAVTFSDVETLDKAKRYMNERYGMKDFVPDNVGRAKQHKIFLESPAELALLRNGDEFAVYDVAPGDSFEIPTAASIERTDAGEWLLRTTAPAEVEVAGVRFSFGPDGLNPWKQGNILR